MAVPPKEATPTASISFLNQQLTGLVAGRYMFRDSTSYTTLSSTTYSIPEEWIGTTVNVVRIGNGTNTANSDTQRIEIPSRPGAPSNVSVTNCTTASNNDGTITGFSDLMQYRLKNESSGWGTWYTVSGTTTVVTGRVPGIYEIRYKSTSTAFASVSKYVTIKSFTAPTTKAVTPGLTFSYTSETFSSYNSNAFYTINGVQYDITNVAAHKIIQPSWFGTTINIVRLGDGINTIDSDVQRLEIPARPAAPANPVGVACTTLQQNNGKINSVTTSMEYRRIAPDTTVWASCTSTSVTDLSPGTYEVRTRATSTAFASNSKSVAVVAFSGTPTYSISLNIEDGYVFPTAMEGYSAPGALTVNVTNTGNQPTGALSVTLAGANASSFTITDNNAAGGISTGGGSASFKVAPKTGLTVGTYTAAANVSGTGLTTRSFNISFQVTSLTPTITGISLTPNTASVQQGSTQSFSATVTSIGGASTAVNWSVTGSTNNNTKISTNGLLTVAANGSAVALTVIATSVFDSSKSATAAVLFSRGSKLRQHLHLQTEQ